MDKHTLGSIGLSVILSCITVGVIAVPISGQGTWETTLQGRDLNGNTATFEAYYDTTLDITWLANANANPIRDNFTGANAWAASLDVFGTTGWRLPTVSPINGSTYNTTQSPDATTDAGTARTTTDGSDGGWRDGSGAPVSEMGHMFYVTLGNLGLCEPDESWCDTQIGWGLNNTGPFSNFPTTTGKSYWTDTAIDSAHSWFFDFSGRRLAWAPAYTFYSWPVYDGDVASLSDDEPISSVPVLPTIWLFGAGLVGLIGVAKRKAA